MNYIAISEKRVMPKKYIKQCNPLLEVVINKLV